MDDSPRLIQQLRSTAQNPATAGDAGTATSHDACGVCAVDSGRSSQDHTRTTHAPGEKPHTAGVRHGGSESSTLHRKLDARLRLRLAQLEVLPGPVSGKGVERSSQGVDKPLPVTLSGKAKGVDPATDVYVFRSRIAGAKTTKSKAAILKDINEAIQTVTVSRRKGRPEFDLSVKEGRIAAGQLAESHGVKWACQALGGVPERTMRRYRDEYRRAA